MREAGPLRSYTESNGLKMDWKLIADITTAAATVVIAVTGVCALIYAHWQLKQSRESEKVKHLIEFVQEFEREPMAHYRKTVAEKRLRGTPYPPEAQKILDFFETIGLLVRRGYLDEQDVWSSFGYWMFNIYADFRDDIEQEQRVDKNYYGDSCDLLKRLHEIEQEMGSSDDRPSKDEIQDFWRDEAKTIVGSPLRKRKPRRAKPKPDNAGSESEPEHTLAASDLTKLIGPLHAGDGGNKRAFKRG
jgi:hypothetical protein